MTNYFLKDENGNVKESANFKFDENCFVTEDEIVRDDFGVLRLKSDFDNCVQTEEYQQKLLERMNLNKKTVMLNQINELDLKSIRALREGGIYDFESGKTWLQYYQEQIVDLRAKIAQLN